MGLAHLLKEIKDIKRLEHILSVLVKHEMGFLVDKFKLKHIIPVRLRIQRHKFANEVTEPEVLREVFGELGGAFIKLGQLLSLRPDLIPHEYSTEFRKLRDSVEPFSGEEAKGIIESELKGRGKALSYINTRPIAAASVGQVHEAVLPDGKRVIVKVQRRDAAAKFAADIDIMYFIAGLLEKRYGNTLFDPVEIVREFQRYTEDELDYMKEARNIAVIHGNFTGSKSVKIPMVYTEYSTSKILTMESIQGISIEKLGRIRIDEKRKKKAVSIIIDAMMRQIFIHGAFHADPHPGNVLMMRDGKIAFIDFGIVGRINEEMKEKLGRLFMHLIEGSAEGVADSMISLNVVRRGEVDREVLAEDMRGLLGRYYDASLSNIDFSLLFHSTLKIAKKDSISVPRDFVLLGKALITLEGLCAELDPGFNIVRGCRPFVKQIRKEMLSGKSIMSRTRASINRLKGLLLDTPARTDELARGISDAEMSMKHIDTDLRSLTDTLDHSVNRISLVLLFIGFMVAAIAMTEFGEPVYMGLPALSLIGFSGAVLFAFMLALSFMRHR